MYTLTVYCSECRKTINSRSITKSQYDEFKKTIDDDPTRGYYFQTLPDIVLILRCTDCALEAQKAEA